MTTVMIVALIFMIARVSMRIGLILLLIWGVIRLVDRWRSAPTAPVQAAPVPVQAAPVPAPVPVVVPAEASAIETQSETKEVKE